MPSAASASSDDSGLIRRVFNLTEQSVRQFVALNADRFEVAGAILYGSRTLGTRQPNSDADLAVLLTGPRQRLLPTTLAMADLAFDVLLETRIKRLSPTPLAGRMRAPRPPLES